MFIDVIFNRINEWWIKPSQTDWVVLKLTVWSLRMLKWMGESPMQYLRSMVMQLWRHRRVGLLSWNKSPPSKIKSTWKRERVTWPLEVIYVCNSHLNNDHGVNLLSLGMFQDLVQRVVRVIASDGILLQVTQMDVCRNEDLEGILVVPERKEKQRQCNLPSYKVLIHYLLLRLTVCSLRTWRWGENESWYPSQVLSKSPPCRRFTGHGF